MLVREVLTNVLRTVVVAVVVVVEYIDREGVVVMVVVRGRETVAIRPGGRGWWWVGRDRGTERRGET